MSVPLLMALWLWLWARKPVRPSHPEHCDCGACNRWLVEQELRRRARTRVGDEPTEAHAGEIEPTHWSLH